MKRKSYNTLKNGCTFELIEKKSRFIAYARNAETEEEALSFIEEIKTKHRDASHNVYAYVIGEHDQFQRSNDDGEPSGTAGRPLLEAIKKADLKNTVIIVTRYFGGILLGAGGLARAYGKSANMAIKTNGKVKKVPAQKYLITFDYAFLGKIDAFLGTNSTIVTEKIYAEKISYFCLFAEEDKDNIIHKTTEITGDNISIIPLNEDAYISIDIIE